MNDKVIFQNGNELDFRLACSILPAGSIPVAMVVDATIVILGSPDFSNSEILEYAAHTLGYTVSEKIRDQASLGRGNFFELT